MGDSPYIKTEIDGALGFVTIDRPDSRGAMNRDMWLALPRAVASTAAHAEVRVLIVRGSGGHFISGADISEFEQLRSDPDLAARYDEGAEATLSTLARLEVPSIAMIDGPCIGGGCLVASGCDLRVASERARFGIPAGRLGLAYPYPALERLVALLGETVTLDLAVTGRVVDAREAQVLGFVQRFYDGAERIEAGTRELAAQIAANAPLAIRYLRMALRRSSRSQLEPDEIRRLAAQCFESEDYREGIAAFLAKRAPRFEGR